MFTNCKKWVQRSNDVCDNNFANPAADSECCRLQALAGGPKHLGPQHSTSYCCDMEGGEESESAFGSLGFLHPLSANQEPHQRKREGS